jgi:hypothetical protein
LNICIIPAGMNVSILPLPALSASRLNSQPVPAGALRTSIVSILFPHRFSRLIPDIPLILLCIAQIHCCVFCPRQFCAYKFSFFPFSLYLSTARVQRVKYL